MLINVSRNVRTVKSWQLVSAACWELEVRSVALGWLRDGRWVKSPHLVRYLALTTVFSATFRAKCVAWQKLSKSYFDFYILLCEDKPFSKFQEEIALLSAIIGGWGNVQFPYFSSQRRFYHFILTLYFRVAVLLCTPTAAGSTSGSIFTTSSFLLHMKDCLNSENLCLFINCVCSLDKIPNSFGWTTGRWCIRFPAEAS